MIQNLQPTRIRFEGFELNLRTAEVLKNGRRIRLQDQPARLLTLLAARPGECVTRAEIQQALWQDDHFVEFEHAINTAVRKIREALEDIPEKPRIIETVPRKGYRFIAAIEPIVEETPAAVPAPVTVEEPEISLQPGIARFLFLFIQVAYLVMYTTALLYVGALEDALAAVSLQPVAVTFPLVIIVSMAGIAVRLYLLSSVGLAHRQAGRKFERIFPIILLLDALWAASPLLAVRTIGFGAAFVGIAGFAYLPFSQRTLIRRIYRDGEASLSQLPSSNGVTGIDQH
jgi:DNA-binding winged helix-turn-helix (wHTH) protein